MDTIYGLLCSYFLYEVTNWMLEDVILSQVFFYLYYVLVELSKFVVQHELKNF